MKSSKWTKEETDFLIKNYENSGNEELIKVLKNRTKDAIILKASSLNIKKYHNNNRSADLGLLLDDNDLTYYWIGFIMADGHVEKNKRLNITLSKRDKEHLEKFKNFLNYKKELRGCKTNNSTIISIMDTKYVSKLCEKFDIKSDKTFFPCNIFKIKDEDLLLSLIIGFIDGDGCIKNFHNRKDFYLSVKCQKNWDKNLEYMSNHIHKKFSNKSCNIKYTKDGKYSYFNIGDSIILKKLKEYALSLKLPIMERKWDVIDLNFVGKYEKTIMNKEKFLELIRNNNNISIKDLCKELNLSDCAIYKYYKQF